MHAYMDRKSQNKQKSYSLGAWFIVIYACFSIVVGQFQFKDFE